MVTDSCKDLEKVMDKNISLASEEHGERLSTQVLYCRLCAQLLPECTNESGGNGSGNTSLPRIKWVHLLKTCGNSSNTVEEVLRKCLPEDTLISFPVEKFPVICLLCHKILMDFRCFLDKITKGQITLKKLLADQLVGENLQIPVPKKRGRPRKELKEVSVSTSSNESFQVDELRRRRPIRIPPRLTCNDVTSEPSLVADNDNSRRNFEDVAEYGCNKLRKLSADHTNISEATRTEEAAEIGSIDIADSFSDAKLSNLTGDRHPKKQRRGRPVKIPRSHEFKCEICHKSYAYFSSLSYHKVSVHEGRRDLRCHLCPKKFSHRTVLANHILTHDTNRLFTCDKPDCKHSFKSRSGLCKHKRTHHSGFISKEFTCEICGVHFTTKSSLQDHGRIHLGEKPFVCKYCGKGFSKQWNLNEHLRIHTKEKPFTCTEPDCQKSFTTSSQLRTHKLTHFGTKSFICTDCGKGFNSLASLKLHSRRHKSDTAKDCRICDKKFSDQDSLKKHLRTHTGEKPYRCRDCNKAFSDPSNYAKHKKIHLRSSNRIPKLLSVSSVVPKTTTVNIGESPLINHSEQSRNHEIYKGAFSEDEKESELATSSPLVEILTSQTLAAFNDDSAVPNAEVIYLYQPAEFFSVSGSDNQNVEVTVLSGGPSTTDALQLEQVSEIGNLNDNTTLTLIAVPTSEAVHDDKS